MRCASQFVAACLLVCATASAADHTPAGDFAESVYRDYPVLRDDSLPDLERVTLLREWSWSRIDYAPSMEANLAFVESVPGWRALPADKLFATFDGRGGVICAPAAIALQRLYEAFGFKAWQICHASNGAPRHSVTVVEIQHNGAMVRCVQDPSFNCYLADRDSGEPLDYLDMVARLRDHRHETIAVIESDWRTAPRWPRTIIPPAFVGNRSAQQHAAANWQVIEDVADVETLEDGTIVITSPRSWSAWHRKACYTAAGATKGPLAKIVAAGHPACVLYWLAWPECVSGPDGAAMLDEAQAVAAGDIGVALNLATDGGRSTERSGDLCMTRYSIMSSDGLETGFTWEQVIDRANYEALFGRQIEVFDSKMNRVELQRRETPEDDQHGE